MITLKSYTVNEIDYENKIITFNAVFSDKKLNMTKRMHYVPQITRKQWGVQEKQNKIKFGREYKIKDYVTEDVFIQQQIESWANAFIYGKELEKEREKVNEDSRRLLNKQIKT